MDTLQQTFQNPQLIQLYFNQTSWKNVPKKVDLHLKDQLLDLVASAPGHMQPAAELWPLAEGSFEVMDVPWTAGELGGCFNQDF